MTPTSNVRWAELLPDEFVARIQHAPIVYLPMGLCEPHGHIAAFGLDTIKADYLCEEAARRFGGIVAPTQGYQIHESGFHAPWLAKTVGEENPRLGGLPPHVVLHSLLYQLRAFHNAGFKAALILSGHSGGSQEDLRRACDAFAERSGMSVLALSDPELVEGKHDGDHAGRYEISQLLAIRPDLVDMSKIRRQFEAGSGGPLAISEDAHEATADYGRQILLDAIEGMRRRVEALLTHAAIFEPSEERLNFETIEEIWRQLQASSSRWTSSRPRPYQTELPSHSQWKPYEHFDLKTIQGAPRSKDPQSI